MAVTPDTEIILLKVPLELDNKNQLTFASKEAQYNYFNSLPKLEYDSCTYQRKDGYMAIYEDADTLQQYNYCMYQNTQYGNKWFYAFITNITYEGNEVSYVYIKTDVYQTWLMEATFKRSFVEREHTNDDSVGANTIPENLEIGEYVNADTPVNNDLATGSYICVALAKNGFVPEGTLASVNQYGGIISGLTYIILKDLNSVSALIYHYTNTQYVSVDDIVSMFMIPSDLVQSTITWNTIPNTQGEYSYIDSSQGALVMNIVNVGVPSSLSGSYNPVNKKLLTYPYRYMIASNNAGTDVIYRYEDFLNFNASPSGICSFDVRGVLTQGCSIKYIPKDYKGISSNLEEGFNCAKFPIGSWTKDSYNIWLRQNAVNFGAANIIGGEQIILGVGGLLSGNPFLMGQGAQIASSGIDKISNVIDEKYQHRGIPNQVEGNVNSSDIVYAMKRTGASFYHMSIKPEYARVIDNYFSMFGYKINRVKMPNLSGRTNWNYVKTIDANIIGDIPQNDLNEIKELFNKGITLWHNPSTFLDYSQPNNIV